MHCVILDTSTSASCNKHLCYEHPEAKPLVKQIHAYNMRETPEAAKAQGVPDEMRLAYPWERRLLLESAHVIVGIRQYRPSTSYSHNIPSSSGRVLAEMDGTTDTDLWVAFDVAKTVLLRSLRVDYPSTQHICSLSSEFRTQATVDIQNITSHLRDSEICLLQAGQELCECHAFVLHQRGRLQAHISPISLLPIEILREIFSYIPPEQHRNIANISTVSHYWRNTAFDCQYLWTEPDWTWPAETLGSWLHRSGERPLSVVFSSEWYQLDYYRGINDDNLRDVLVNTSRRWTSLQHDGFDSSETHLLKLAMKPLDLSNIDTLILETDDFVGEVEEGPENRINIGDFPKLKCSDFLGSPFLSGKGWYRN